MSFILKALFMGNTEYAVWGVLLKVSFILVCIGILLLIMWSRQSKDTCKSCGQQVSSNENHCVKCGMNFTGHNTRANKKAKAICAIFTAILLCIFTVSIIFIAKHTTGGNMATGIYSGYHPIYVQNEEMWGAMCDKALTEGSFNHVVPAADIPSAIMVNASCKSGTLILNVKQDGIVESYNITNTNGQQKIDLSWLTSGADMQLGVEHTIASDVTFLISWQPQGA